jgi:hypothetical protein
MKQSRREFTLMSTGTVLAAMATPSAAGSLIPDPQDANGSRGTATGDIPWYQKIRRVGQTNFNEKDPLHGNVEEWADYWASAKVEAVALSVSGPVAFYPTDIPYYLRSPYLGGRDFFGECVRAAKARGLRVYGRMSPDIVKTREDLLAAHPLWFRREQNGSLQSPAPGIAFTCQFSNYFTELQPAVIHEVNTRYNIDGFYMNGWPTMQVCYCENCRKIGDPHSKLYKDALMAGAAELINLYKKMATENKPDNFYSCNLGGGLTESGLDQWQLTRSALWYTADNQSRQAVVAPVWQDSQQVKFARCLMGDRPVAAVTASYSRSGKIMWRNVTGEPAEAECRMAQTSAAGGVIWYHWLGLEQGFKDDRRWQKLGREFLSWHASHDKHFHNVRSLAKIAILAAPRSVTLYDGPSDEAKTDSIEGMYAILVEARIPFDFVHEDNLTPEQINRYAALILPNVALLSNSQCNALEQYVEQGGSLLATFETGLYDETGKPRSDFALGPLFGISRTGPRQRADYKSVQPILSVHLQEICRRNAITAGFEETDWIAGPVWSIPLAPVPNPIMTFIEPYPGYPPEEVYMREHPTKLPSVVLEQKGNARLAYLSGDMDASFWRLDNWDLGRQLLNAIHWVLGDSSSVQIEGEGLMEVYLWETVPGFALHMVNYNGPNAYRGKMRKLVDLGPQTVRIELPREVKIKTASLLRSEATLPFRQHGRVVEFNVPSIGSYEVAALEI